MASKMDKTIELMVYTNMTQREIAEELDVNESTISRWKKKKEFGEKLDATQKEFLAKLTAPAMRTLKWLLSAENEMVRLNTAKDILDRTGYKPSTHTELDVRSADVEIIITGYDDADTDD